MPSVHRDKSGAVLFARTPKERERRDRRKALERGLLQPPPKAAIPENNSGKIKQLAELVLCLVEALPRNKREQLDGKLLESVREVTKAPQED